MLIPSVEQILILLFSFIAGVVTGILFDLYRVIRGFQNPNKYITFFEDILFWVFASIVVFIFLLKTSFAYLNFYCYLYIIFGLYLYIRFLSKKLISVLSRFLNGVFSILRIIKNYLLYPLQLLLNFKNKN
ncbi:MAG: spore cortex biosynthesis protein YabQ [Clostridiaceae bacterium]